jgi:hypothetical protein
MTTRKNGKRKKVPMPIKLAMLVIGAFFTLIAAYGIAHGQANMTANFNPNAPAQTSTSPPSTDNSGELAKAKGCIGNDQIAGKTYIAVRCLQDPQLNQVMCDNWPGPGNNATCPNTTVPHNIARMNMTNSTP